MIEIDIVTTPIAVNVAATTTTQAVEITIVEGGAGGSSNSYFPGGW